MWGPEPKDPWLPSGISGATPRLLCIKPTYVTLLNDLPPQLIFYLIFYLGIGRKKRKEARSLRGDYSVLDPADIVHKMPFGLSLTESLKLRYFLL
jgi:hypothetical protein